MIKGLPQKLQTLRVKYGYSQKQVAEKLGVSPSTFPAMKQGNAHQVLKVFLPCPIFTNVLLTTCSAKNRQNHRSH